MRSPEREREWNMLNVEGKSLPIIGAERRGRKAAAIVKVRALRIAAIVIADDDRMRNFSGTDKDNSALDNGFRPEPSAIFSGDREPKPCPYLTARHRARHLRGEDL